MISTLRAMISQIIYNLEKMPQTTAKHNYFSAYPLFQNFHYYVDEDNKVSIIKYAGNEKDVSVPERIQEKPDTFQR